MRFKEGSQSFQRRYLIFEPLGAGGMAAVYRAKDRLGGYVALKRLVTDATRIAARNAVASPVETTYLVPSEEDSVGLIPRREDVRTLALDRAPRPAREANVTLPSTALPSVVVRHSDAPPESPPEGALASDMTVELPESSRPGGLGVLADAPTWSLPLDGVNPTVSLGDGLLTRSLSVPVTISTLAAAYAPAAASKAASAAANVDTLARPLMRAQAHAHGSAAGGDPFSEDGMRLRLALAAEFQTLSSVRHPNVISVLDYGFDETGQPYFTMELLERAGTILEAGIGLPLTSKVSLLEQMLQALLYLHRRRVIHRDLKPGNVLVVAEQVKVVDFGVAVLAEQSREQGRTIAGTPAYMAPELFHGKHASEASDLYAVGVIAYELFTGKSLFNNKDVWAAVADALYKIPDLSQIDPRIAPVVGKLLAKDPTQRYADAAEVIAALGDASGQLLRVETAATRESCLQAARLVGRDEELSLLTRVLDQVLDGRGSAWLVGGESGVGKSRLLDELRARALVAGAAVMRGQEVSEGGAPYHVWGDVLRWLVLLTDPRDAEASILKAFVPDIPALLGRGVPDAADVSPDAFQARLASTVEDLLRRLRQPALILLEDLHWSRSDSIKLLARITAVTAEMPVLIVASYRDDERPDLPATLRAMQPIKLNRLTPVGIAALSESMIGPSGARPEVIERLILETEGNPFFLVEVVRTLAERAGQLDRIADAPLSERVSSRAVDQIVGRRLRQVPRRSRPLLEAAAVAGRRIDLKLMQAIDPHVRVDDWLAACTGAAVLDVQDGRPRFAHDKLREGLRSELSEERRRILHRQIAAAIEVVYPDDSAHTSALAHHWAAAGDEDKAAYYAGKAGEQALQSSAYQEALEFFEQALSLVPEEPEEVVAAPPNGRSGALLGSIRALGQVLMGRRSVQSGRARVLRARWEGLLSETHGRLGNHVEGLKHGEKALRQLGVPMPHGALSAATDLGGEALQLGLRSLIPSAFLEKSEAAREVLGSAAQIQRRVTETFFYTQESLPLFLSGLRMLNLGESAGPSPELAGMYTMMGLVVGLVPLHALADRWCQRGYELAEERCKPYELAFVLQHNSVQQMIVGRWAQAEERLRRAIAIVERSGDRRQWEEASMMLSGVWSNQGRLAEGHRLGIEIAASARRRGDGQTIFWGAITQTTIAIRLGLPDGLEQLEAALPWVESAGMASDVIYGKGIQALACIRRGDLETARKHVERAVPLLVEKRPVAYWIYYGAAGVVEAALALWEAAKGGPDAERAALGRLAEQACKGFWVFAQIFPFSRASAWLFQGLYEQLSGRPGRARRAFTKAIAAAERLVMPYERARAHYNLGRHASGHERTRNLMRAVEFFAEVGARPEQEKAQAALERS